ncbi:low-temperature-induced cysteine proteinase-like protein [Carex littledalei]|uniref:Low-temperature-induced cysteine proteinase-like protein n=1 Tax=Carex littledalei TaxID=544730 RepID=A0A833UXD3_9POAL|nr:low-temperature-induced cysteine proteinase-like protein [Carex littledalei]
MFLKNPQIGALVLLLWQSMAVLILSIPTDFSIAGYNPYPTNAHKLHIAQLFEQWMETHEKIYSQPEDRTRGFENFLRNYEYVNGRNANGGHSVGMNNLADLSNEEFREKYLSKFQMGKRRERRVGSDNERNYESCDAPPSLNWEEKGVVTAVKNQGQCGSCWSFSTTGAIEGINAITTGELISLSEQELVECVTTNWGCNGGYMDYAFEWIIQNGGISTESSYPYTAKDGICNITQANNKVVTIDGYQDVPPNDEALLCAVLKQPISVGIDAGARDFQLYKEGIYNGNCSSDPEEINHAVLLVGYGSENGTDYWIVKNSWGARWGNQGYIYIKRDQSLPYASSICTDFSSLGYNFSNYNAEQQELVQLFEQWMKKHEKIYARPEDKARGFENFAKNFEYVHKWNAN